MKVNCARKIALIFLISAYGIQTYSQNIQLPEHNNGRRHRGFFLSWAGGAYHANIDMEDNNGYSIVKGIGGVMDFKIGGTLVENLILHATWLNHGIFEPKVYNENGGLAWVEANNIELSEVMIGGGITYYTPINFLLSTSIGYGGFSWSNDTNNEGGSSEGGFCLQIKAGKEWWVSRKLALGLAAYYHKTIVHNNPSSDIDEKLNSNNFGILLNLTLNGRK